MILIKNCLLIATMDDQGNEFKNRDILVVDNKISRIGENIKLSVEEQKHCELIDGSSLLVTPGLVNTHHHMYQTLTRNLPGAQDAKLFDWLKYLYPIWGRVGSDGIYFSTLLATAELLKTGATTTTDHMYLYPRDFPGDIPGLQFAAAEETGIRFAPTRGSMTLGESQGGLPPDNLVQSPETVLADSVSVIEKYHDADPFSMRKVILAPCSPFSVEAEVMQETAKIARQKDVKLHTHLAETEDENEFCMSQYGKRPLALMADWDWLGEDVFFAHGIWFEDDELDILRQTGTGISHCPTSNMRLGSGIARIREMMDMGIPVGLGVDGSASNDSSDILGETRNAMLLQRVKYGADAFTAREALSVATRGGADILGIPVVGRVQEGMAADLSLWDMDQLQYAGALSDPLAAILFSGYKHETKYTIVNGNVVVRDGLVTGLDEAKLRNEINEISSKMMD